MKVLYLLPDSSLGDSSVKKKVMKQIHYLNLAGAQCRGAFFTKDVDVITPHTESIDYVPVKKTNSKHFPKIGEDNNLIRSISSYLDNVGAEYDAIYFRYPNASYGLYKIVKKHKNILFEINDNSIVTVQRNKIGFSIRRSLIIHMIQHYYVPLFNEVFFGGKIFNSCKAISCVSGELFETIKKEYKITSPVPIIIGNGIDVASLPVRNYKFKKEKVLSLIMLKGAATNAVYLGNDRIIKSIAAYKGDWKIKLLFAGKHFEEEKKLIKELNAESGFEFIGYINDAEINKYVESSDVAIGTLAAYRSKIDEISSLKAREYYSRGIPFIYGYTDTDIDKSEEAMKYCMKVPNDDSAIDMQKIIDFSLVTLPNENHPAEMNAIASEILDFRKKMKKMFDQLKSVYA